MTVLLTVTVLSGSRILCESKIVSCSSSEMFGNLLSRVQEEKFAERRVDKENIDNGKCSHEVPLDAPLSVTVEFNYRSIFFHLVVDSESNGMSSSTRPNTLTY